LPRRREGRGWGRRGTLRRARAARRRRREVFGRRQEYQLVGFRLLRRGRRRLWRRLWGGRLFLRFRLWSLRLWNRRLWRRRLWFGLLGRCPKRSIRER